MGHVGQAGRPAGRAGGPALTDPATRGPWRVLGSRIAYVNPWLRVREDRVIRPDGKLGLYGVVEPENNAAIVALDGLNRVILVREFVYPIERESLQIPSGGIGRGESGLRAAQRELLEETGYQAGRWDDLGVFFLSGGISTQSSQIFLARDITPGPARPEGTESLAVEMLDLGEALRLADLGELRDSPTLVGLYRAARYLQFGSG